MPDPRAATPRERATERHALAAGIVLALLGLAALALLLVLAPDVGRRLAAQVAAHALVGRETGLPTGIALGVAPALAGLFAATQDLVVLLVGYGLVMAAARGSLRIPWLARFAERPKEGRERFGARTEPFGVALLALGLWIPFFPGGALTAALLARVAGYRPHVFLPILAASAAAADAAYAFTLDQLQVFAPRWAPPLVALGVAATVAVVLAVRRR